MYVVAWEGETVIDPIFPTVLPPTVTEVAPAVFQDSVDVPPCAMAPGEAEIAADGNGLPADAKAAKVTFE